VSVLRPAYQNKAAMTVLTIAVIGCCTDFCWRQLRNCRTDAGELPDGDIENSPPDAPA
jgi:hypothetical protein